MIQPKMNEKASEKCHKIVPINQALHYKSPKGRMIRRNTESKI